MEEEDDWILVADPPPAAATAVRFMKWFIVVFTWSRDIASAATARMMLFVCVYCAARYVGLGHALAMQCAVFCLAR